ncbi:MAG TPA: DUF4258 domain-containing protein [Candidatus Kapabacteria bacterium]|nr:DUF4258 domain-containing protein [Candidatus Kapabacteria bacterium]
MSNTSQSIRDAAQKAILFTPHAISQMTAADRLITPDEVVGVVQRGEIIEDYPHDRRGHSCLLLGTGHNGRSLHVVCAPKKDHLTIITAYIPDVDFWEEAFRKRIQS